MTNKIVNGIEVPLTDADLKDMEIREADYIEKKAQQKKVEYMTNRLSEYPSIQDQLMLLWNSMDIGEIPISKEFYNSIKSINDKYPAS